MKSKLTIKTGIELAAMVDIVFLLVTYFLINATLARNPAIKIELPKSISAETELQKRTVIHIDAKNQIYLNDKKVTLKNLPALLKATVKNKEKDYVIIKGDKNSSYQTVISVMDHVSKAGIVHFNLATDK